jgi:type I restriction enzyme, S subunit
MSRHSLWVDGVRLRWPAARLKDHVTLTNGFPFDSSGFNDAEGVPIVRIRDLLARRTGTRYRGPVPEEVMVCDGDIVVGMDGDFNSVVWDGGRAALNQRLCVLRAKATVDQRFLGYVLPVPLQAINDITYFTTVKHLSSVDLLNERIPLPPMGEQRRIADFLDAETARIHALIAKKRRVIQLLEERRVAMAVGAVSAPEWPHVKLTLLARLGTGHTPSRDRPEWWENPTIPWITTGDVGQMRGDRIEFIDETKLAISEVGLANSAAEVHPAGTVVLSRTASVGFSAIMARPMATSQDFATWTCGPQLQPRFLLLCLRAMRSELLGRLAMGSTHKTIYMPEIESIRIPLPPLGDQDTAVDEAWKRLRPIDQTVSAIERQIDLLREHRQALITAAVTGHLDIAERQVAASSRASTA